MQVITGLSTAFKQVLKHTPAGLEHSGVDNADTPIYGQFLQ